MNKQIFIEQILILIRIELEKKLPEGKKATEYLELVKECVDWRMDHLIDAYKRLTTVDDDEKLNGIDGVINGN
jgi:hypothetical protein